MKTISILGGRVIDPASERDETTNLHIVDDKIVAVGEAPAQFEAHQTLDATGQWVIPGLVDLAARLREPGLEYRASLDSELAAAAAGGITSLCCPPDTDPPLDEPGLVEMLRQRARERQGTRLYPLGALTIGLQGEVITEMAHLSSAGCVGLSQPPRLPADTQTLLRAMQYASTFGYTVWLHPIDAHLGRNGVAHGGAVASRLGLASVPVTAETVAMHIIFELVRQTQCRVHLCRLSSAAGVALVEQAKAEGLPVTCDVGVHHLHLTDVDIGHFDSRFRVNPPFRGQRDRDALRGALASGVIDVVCSDHTPVDDNNKHLPFAQAEPGASALELLLPLVMKWAEQDKIAPAKALARATCQAGAVINVPAGTLKPGAVADICIYDPNQHWTVNAQTLHSMCQHTPFFGLELLGRVRQVLIAGELQPDLQSGTETSH